MFKINLKTAWRSLSKNKAFAFINTLGLAVGVCAFLIISLYIRNQVSYDQFHNNKDNIYRVQMNRYDNGELSTQWAAGAAGIGPALKEGFPEVEQFVKLHGGNAVLQYDEKVFKETEAFYATQHFFEMFSIDLIKGVDSLVLKDPYSIVLSKTTAKRYFGDQDPIGKTLKQNGRNEFSVTGVFEDMPTNSHMKADILYSFESWVDMTNERARTAWDWDGFYTYITLRPGTDPDVFEEKLPDFISNKWGEEMAEYNHMMEFKLQAVTDIHLYSDYMYEMKANGDGRATYFLLIIAVFIILIAWVNYINLSTAKSMERAREVGIRKVLGSLKNQLTRQFLFESFILNFLAMALALSLALIAIPAFNAYSGIELSLNGGDLTFWMTVAILYVGGSLLSGIYPALVLSGFQPTSVLKGRLSGSSGGAMLRKGLVVFQFIASMVLIVGTVTVFEQLRYMKNQDLGFNMEHTLIIEGPNVVDSLYESNFDVFKQSLLSQSSISAVTSSTAVPGGQPGWNAGGIRLVEQRPDEAKQYRVIGVDGDFMDTYEMELVAGRLFDEGRSTERSHIIFNESGARFLGFEAEDALDRDVFFWGDTFKIVGVIKDYHQESLKKSFEPLIFRYFPAVTDLYSVKVSSSDLAHTVGQIEQEWNVVFPGNPFSYYFLDDHFNEQYHAELRFGKVFGLFASLAIFISCLGLFGLALYMTKHRTKEVGIRKVLGASATSVMALLSWDFSKLVLLSIAIAIPISWLLIQNWLQNFANKISFSPWLLLIPALLLMMIAIASISIQTARLALSNPVDSLRDE